MPNDFISRSLRLIFTLVQPFVLIVALHEPGISQNTAPILLSQPGSTRAVAVESVTIKAEPFSLTSSVSFSSDRRTRIVVFARNAELATGEGLSAFTSNVQDASGRIYPLTVEHASPVPNCEGVTMLVIRLSDDLGNVGDVLLRINLHGMSSNRVRVGIGHIGGGPPDDNPSNQVPQVSISAPVTAGVAPLTVGFTSSAHDPDGSISSYSWTFGDGQTSSQAAPTHVYQSAGSFTARLTVTDNLGATASAAVTITVSNPTPTSGGRFKVLQWNVAYGRGTDNIIDLNRQATWMANMQVDLISLNEVPPGDVSRYADLVRQKTGLAWYSHYGLLHPSQAVGQLILSRFPIQSTGLLQLSAAGDPYTSGRSVIRVSVNIGGKTVHFFSTHLSPGNSLTYTRIAQINEMTNWASGFSGPRIIAGDFNLSPNWAEYPIMTGSYYDSWAQAYSAGTAVSYPDNPEGRTRKGRVDYINYSKFSNLAIVQVRMPDQRDLNNRNVVIWVGNSNDWGVRPSDHNFLVSTFDVW